MDEDKKRKVMLGLVIFCLVLAIGITVVTNIGGSGGGGSQSNEPVQMLCMNPDCEMDFELSAEEYREQMMQGGMMGPGPMAQASFECPECGEKYAFLAIVCKECDAIFMQDYSSGDFPDRCPECDYSDIEARRDKER